MNKKRKLLLQRRKFLLKNLQNLFRKKLLQLLMMKKEKLPV